MNAMQNILVVAPLLAAALVVVGLFIAEIIGDLVSLFSEEDAMSFEIEFEFTSVASTPSSADALALASAQCTYVMLKELDRAVQCRDRSIALAAIDGALAMRLLSPEAEASARMMREDLLSRGHMWPLAILPC